MLLGRHLFYGLQRAMPLVLAVALGACGGGGGGVKRNESHAFGGKIVCRYLCELSCYITSHTREHCERWNEVCDGLGAGGSVPGSVQRALESTAH